MVKGILNLINKESGSLHQAAYFLGLFAFLSQILGLVRDKLLAHKFGAGLELDIYYAAFRIPDFLFVSIASLVSVSVLIPVLVKHFKSKEESREFINNVFSFFFIAIIVACVIFFFFTPFILKMLFKGFSEESFSELILLTRILLLSPIFLGFSNLFGSIVQANQRFVLYSLSPIVYNLSIVLGVIFFTPSLGILGVVLGVVIGAFLHLVIQIPFVFKVGLFPRFSLSNLWSNIKDIIYLSAPRTIALSSNNFALLFLISFASSLSTGSIAVFNLSFNLQSVPLGIVGVSYSLAAFPTLSRYFIDKEHQKFADQITSAAKHIIFWALPVTVLFIVLRAQIVRVVLGSGEFSWSDTRLTAAALAIFAVSVVPQSLNLLFTRGYYAAQSTRKPLLINILSSFLTIILGFSLINIFKSNDLFRYFIETLFRVADIEGTAVLMLPLGFSLGMILNAFLLWILFERNFKGSQKALMQTFFQSFSASVIMGFVAYIFLNIFASVFDLETILGIFLQGFLSGILAIISGTLILIGLENREIKEIWNNMHKRFWKTKPIGSDSEII